MNLCVNMVFRDRADHITLEQVTWLSDQTDVGRLLQPEFARLVRVIFHDGSSLTYEKEV